MADSQVQKAEPSDLVGQIASMPDLKLRFNQAKAHVDQNKLAEAADAFSELMTQVSEVFPELSIDLVPVYYSYGDALLRLVEAKSELFGTGGAEEDEDLAEEDAENVQPATADADANGSADEEDVEDAALDAAEDREENLEVAFELIECARVSLERHVKETPEDKEVQARLAVVLRRLGDHAVEAAHFTTALEEYAKCLAIRQLIMPHAARRMADVYSCLASTYMLLGNVKSTEDPRKHMQSAMEHYELAAAALRSTIVDQLAGVSGCEAFLASVKDAKPETMQVEAAVASSASASAAEVAVEAGTQWVMKTILADEWAKVSEKVSDEAKKTDAAELCAVLDSALERVADIRTEMESTANADSGAILKAAAEGGAAAVAALASSVNDGQAVTSQVGFSQSAIDAAASKPVMAVAVKKKPAAAAATAPSTTTAAAAPAGVAGVTAPATTGSTGGTDDKRKAGETGAADGAEDTQDEKRAKATE